MSFLWPPSGINRQWLELIIKETLSVVFLVLAILVQARVQKGGHNRR